MLFDDLGAVFGLRRLQYVSARGLEDDQDAIEEIGEILYVKRRISTKTFVLNVQHGTQAD